MRSITLQGHFNPGRKQSSTSFPLPYWRYAPGFRVGYRIRTDVSGFADHCLNPSANPTCFVKVPGLEPRLTEPKSVVLPLHHTSISCRSRKTRTLTDGFGDRNATVTPYSCIILMIWTHISFHPTLEELLLGVKKVVIPFIKVFPVSLVDIVSPFVPQILSQIILPLDHP